MNLLRQALRSLLDAAHRLMAQRVAPSDLSRRAIVFAPHPDDEALGCGGTILRKRQAGADIRVVFMTDGSASHAQHMDGRELASLRRNEALSAVKALGVSECTFLDFPDEHLGEHREAAVARVREILREFGPAEVYVPHQRDRVPDHEATYEIVDAALAGLPGPVTVLEYPVWLFNTWPWTRGGFYTASLPKRFALWCRDVWWLTAGCRLRVDVRDVADHKTGALASHRSQFERIAGDHWPVLADVSNGDFLRCFGRGAERFRASVRRS